MVADLLIAVAVFAATNVDDLFVLLAFFSDPAFRRRQVVVGQYVGMGLLVGASLLIAWGVLLLPLSLVGFLGIVPFGIGLKKLWDLRRGHSGLDDPEKGTTTGRFGTRTLAVASVTIANGGDNIAVYVPVFAAGSGARVGLFVVVFAVMLALWLVAAYVIVNHPSLRSPVRRYGRFMVPLVLMALGVYIMVEGEVWAVLL